MKDNEEAKPAAVPNYTYMDLIKFENPQVYSSIGKMLSSDKITMPKYSFGTADRKGQAKVYSNKNMAKTDFAGKYSPGPIYQVAGTDKFTYNIDGQTKFGTNPRNTLDTGAKYDHYLRKDVDFEP